MKKLIVSLLVILWLLISLLVRVYGLDRSPISLDFDEASLGYNAYSLMQTGKDEYGVPWPITLRSFNDYKPALYAYATIPFYWLFGVDQSSVRLASAVFGTISLLFFWLIFRRISGVGALKALLIAVLISFLPWRLHFSRVAFESNVSMAFLTMTVWCLLNLAKNRFYQVGAIVCSILAIYSYHSARLAIPILFLLFLIDPLSQNLGQLVRQPISQLKKLWPLLVVLLCFIPIFVENDTSAVLRRYNQANVFGHYFPFGPSELLPAGNPWLAVLANPVYYLLGILFGHLVAYFGPANLALNLYPWVTKSAQGISGSGPMGWFGGLLVLIGGYFWIKGLYRRSEYRWLLYWLLAGIAPALVTWEWFHLLRSLNIFPAVEVIIGLGILSIIGAIKKPVGLKVAVVATIVVLAGFTSLYNLLNEYNYGAWETNGEFQPGGFKEGAALLNQLRSQYTVIYIDSSQVQNFTMLQFYMKYPPENIQKYASIRPPLGTDGSLDFNFDNFVYRQFSWQKIKDEPKFAAWTSSEVLDDEIKATPGTKIYRIYNSLGNLSATVVTKN